MKTIIISLFLFTASFISDSLTAYLWGSIPFNGVLIYTIITFLCVRHWLPFTLGIFALASQSFLLYDTVGLNYLYLIPLFIFIGTLKNFLHSQFVVATLGLLMGILFKTLFLVFYKGSSWPSLAYTFIQIGVNLVLLYRYLKCFPTARRGNRF